MQYVTAYGNGMLPLYATQISYLMQYVTALCNRLWKWKRTVWATAYGNSVLQLTPIMSYNYDNSVLQSMTTVSYSVW
jgi:hypothetical protein